MNITTTKISEAPTRLQPDIRTTTLAAGVSGARRNAAAALASGGNLLAFCEEERITRVRHAGIRHGELPEAALTTVLHQTRRHREDIVTFASGEEEIYLASGLTSTHFPHHFAHAATAFLTSSFAQSAILVCDGSADQISVWRGTASGVSSCNWPRSLQGFAALYSQCAALFGFDESQEHRLEGLARLDASGDDGNLSRFFRYANGQIVADPSWLSYVRDRLFAEGPRWSLHHGAHVAAGFQRAMAGLLVDLVADIRTHVGSSNLCLGGGLFYNTFFNSAISRSGTFDAVFVAPNPGNTGNAAGAAMFASCRQNLLPRGVSPFLGPSFDSEEIKAALDNCKLSYGYFSGREVIHQVVSALTSGHLVGWFQGQMEWGHRALGNRSILASPDSPHVMENLNVFLKHRPRHTAYGLSVCEDDAAREFRGPNQSAWMEYDMEVLDRDRFRHVLPESTRTLRVQTVNDDASLFADLHKAFGAATGGTGVLVNTSFNGFSEPIVCSPRDAIRVFFGTGLDLLAIGGFIVRK